MRHYIDVFSSENNVPEGFCDWSKRAITQNDEISIKVTQLLEEDQLQEAIDIFHSIFQTQIPDIGKDPFDGISKTMN